MRKFDGLALVLAAVGALNWGLVAIARFDLVAWIFGGLEFGETNVASRIVYGLVGVAGVYVLARLGVFLGRAPRTEWTPAQARA
jgi:uncharacterized membrane protein YuzA (DUF378 family)